jgi:hypothetical protein
LPSLGENPFRIRTYNAEGERIRVDTNFKVVIIAIGGKIGKLFPS